MPVTVSAGPRIDAAPVEMANHLVSQRLWKLAFGAPAVTPPLVRAHARVRDLICAVLQVDEIDPNYFPRRPALMPQLLQAVNDPDAASDKLSRMIAHDPVLTADVSGFFISVAMYIVIPTLVLFVQVPVTRGYGFGASIVVSGLVLVPLSLCSFLASRLLTVYERRFGPRSMIPLGSLLFAASAAFFGLEHRALWEAFVASAVAGLAIGFTYGAMPGFIVRAVPPQKSYPPMHLSAVSDSTAETSTNCPSPVRRRWWSATTAAKAAAVP